MIMRIGLIGDMTRREIAARYRGSALGLLWSFLTPLMMLAVYTFVFGVVLNTRWEVSGRGTEGGSTAEFALVLFSGLLIFQFFSEVVSAAPGLVLGRRNFVKKILFPLEILPVVTIGAAMFHALINTAVLLVFVGFVFGLPATIILSPLPLLALAVICLGLAWFLAAVGVYFRDIGQIIGPVVTAALFLSPVFFSREALPDWLQPWLSLNPIAIPVEAFRDVVIFGRLPDFGMLGLYTVVALGFTVLGYLFFQKTRRGFADVL